jgi:CYTH domain-containing protein
MSPRAPMNPPRYSRLEHERRFLVAPDHLEFLQQKPFSRRFDDRYLRCGRLRLRTMTNSDDGVTTYKLTKKYAYEHPDAPPIVSVWLTADEHAALHRLDGDDLTKTRWYDDYGGHTFSVDVFAGSLAGLVICEVEAASADASHRDRDRSHQHQRGWDCPAARGRQLDRAAPQQLPAERPARGRVLGPRPHRQRLQRVLRRPALPRHRPQHRPGRRAHRRHRRLLRGRPRPGRHPPRHRASPPSPSTPPRPRRSCSSSPSSPPRSSTAPSRSSSSSTTRASPTPGKSAAPTTTRTIADPACKTIG